MAEAKKPATSRKKPVAKKPVAKKEALDDAVVEEKKEVVEESEEKLGPRTLRAMSNGSSTKKIEALKAIGA